MKYASLIFGLLFLFSPMVYGEQSPTAKATLHNAQGEEVGNATFTQMPDGVKISLSVRNLSQGPHAFHIHAVGLCEPPDFKTAGGHFNPYGKKHGLKNPEGAHAGDLQNISVGPDGTAQTEASATFVTLGEGGNSLFHPEGTALVIHANADDDVTDPAGNAGARIACGVIEK